MKHSIHIFERAGLGVAPFKFVGCETRIYKASPDSPPQAGWSCEFCGTPIMQCCKIKDANGVQFIVGNECVYKTDDKNLVSEAKAEILKIQREARHKKEAEKIEAARADLAGNVQLQTVLSLEPNPNKWQADKGGTLLDWVNFMFDNAGNKGKLEAAAVIKKFNGVPVTEEAKEAFAARQAARAEAEAALVRAEEEKQAEAAKARQAAIDANADIIAVLNQKRDSDFIRAMIENLSSAPLGDLTSRQFAIVSDIYAKSFGRYDSAKYWAAIEDLETRIGKK